jgi:hypothetical protein
MDLPSQVHSVEPAWHLNVGEEEADVWTIFHYAERRRGVFRLDHFKTVVFKEVRSLKPQKRLILRDKDDRSYLVVACVHPI